MTSEPYKIIGRVSGVRSTITDQNFIKSYYLGSSEEINFCPIFPYCATVIDLDNQFHFIYLDCENIIGKLKFAELSGATYTVICQNFLFSPVIIDIKIYGS